MKLVHLAVRLADPLPHGLQLITLHLLLQAAHLALVLLEEAGGVRQVDEYAVLILVVDIELAIALLILQSFYGWF